MPPKQIPLHQHRFPVSPELCRLQAFCGGLDPSGHNQANFECPWYMFFSSALPTLLSTPPASESGPPSSRTRFAIAPQYIFSLLRERTDLDAQAEDKIRKKFNRIPDFVVWYIDGAPQQYRSPRPIDKVRTQEHALEYVKGTSSVSQAALLLCVEIKSLPDIRVAHVVADLPRSLKKAQKAKLAEAQMELMTKLVVHFSSCLEGEEVVVLACAGSAFTWNVAVREGSDVLPMEIHSSEDDSSYLTDSKPEHAKPTACGVTNASDNTVESVQGSRPERPKRKAAMKNVAITSTDLATGANNAAAQHPSVTGVATDKGKDVAIPQKPSGHGESQPEAGSSKDGCENSANEVKPTRKKPAEMRVAFKGKWSTPFNWNDEKAAPQKAKLWEAIREANPGIEFWK